MILIIKLFFFVIASFFFVIIATALSVVLRIRHNLQNPFSRGGNTQPPPPPGKGEIIEGEFKVLDEERK